MSTYTITQSRRVPYPAATAYGIFADYHVAHPQVCPPKYFRNFKVLQGGTGAGTVLTFDMMVLGRANPTRAEVSEPEPGRVLREYYPDTGIVTTFTVDPRDDGRASEVTIHTVFPAKRGILGALERAFTTRFLRGVYIEELARMEAYAASLAGASAPAASGRPATAGGA